MSPILVSILVVLALILIEALFVASEIALVSLRESQLETMAQQGRRGQVVAKLVRDQNRWLATVQIGVTLTALLSSAYGAITLSESAKRGLISAGLGKGLAGFVGVVGVTLVITFVTLVIGELAPKRLALQRPEGTARAVAPFLNRMAAVVRPFIFLLSVCTNGVVRLFGGDPAVGREAVSSEELRLMVAGNETLNSDERELIDEIFDAGDRQLREVLVPRTEVTFLDGQLPIRQAARIAASEPHSRYPVIEGSADNVIGFVHVRDFLNPELAGRSIRLEEIARPVKMLPTSKQVLSALSEMRAESTHLAIVVDEYGGTAGIVTLEDLIEELIGDIQDEYDVGQAGTTRLVGGVMEVDGLLNLDDFMDETGIELPDGPYETAAGFMVAQLGRLPALGDEVVVAFDAVPGLHGAGPEDGDEDVEREIHRSQLRVAEMDGRRIARIRITRLPEGGAAEAPGADAPGSDAPAGALAADAPAAEVPVDEAPAAEASAGGPESAADITSGDHSNTDGDDQLGQAGAGEEIPGEPDQSEPRI
ncbi:hemolysin family protein [Catenulispora rubra]|uniref:hemolysin family protein n=1 Tax=Catenulispora rubra TaxID=280293 RepID=UPI0018927AA7|nr:hemolysin family protein [Catenulispora rubra]